MPASFFRLSHSLNFLEICGLYRQPQYFLKEMPMKEIVEAVDGKRYKVVNGTYYHPDTPDDVIAWMETFRERNNQRIEVAYGDPNTGKDWQERNFTQGYVGRSIGPVKISLLIHNRRSLGGCSLTTENILKIAYANKGYCPRVVWQHPNYHV